ncbi:MAG TPA: KxYKxGKxW signal peptide domain-containing protein [Ligilactobacillus aviarius]|nr:KxYKxGKxW signal peptide domain-containing protein [Ligilactobacillus aviarius]
MFNEEKKRYKLYKSGKMWVTAPILFLGVTLGTTSVAKADQIQSHSISQPVAIQQKQISSVSTSNQKNAVVLSSKATNSSSQISNSSSQVKDQSSQNQEHQTVTNFAAVPAKNEQNQQAPKQNTSVSVPQPQLKQQTVVQKPENQSQLNQQSKKQNQIVQPSQGSLDKYTFAENHPNAKQVNQNNNWYLQENGKNLTGFQKINDQNKICYYNPANGAMVYGQQKIGDKWYLFDKVTGALQFGYQ